MRWIKADSLLIERLGYGWTKDKPAPWEVGLLFACGRLANGGRLSVRDLAAYMGWSKRRGWQCLQEAKALTWTCTQSGTQTGTPSTSNPVHLQPIAGRIRDTSRARALLDQIQIILEGGR